jgi:hypothetical protein
MDGFNFGRLKFQLLTYQREAKEINRKKVLPRCVDRAEPSVTSVDQNATFFGVCFLRTCAQMNAHI